MRFLGKMGKNAFWVNFKLLATLQNFGLLTDLEEKRRLTTYIYIYSVLQVCSEFPSVDEFLNVEFWYKSCANVHCLPF